MKKAPESLHTLIASGDVYIRANQPLQEIPEVDVVCYVYGSSLRWPRITGFLYRAVSLRTTLDFMLQKPSLETLGELAG